MNAKILLQVDFGQIRYVYAVVTQGLAGLFPGWVTAYKIQYLGNQWMPYKEKNSIKVGFLLVQIYVKYHSVMRKLYLAPESVHHFTHCCTVYPFKL